MPSTVIRWFHYAPDKRELLIGFRSGRRYAYLEVPETIYADMRRAFSKGEFFNANIRDRYAFEARDEP